MPRRSARIKAAKEPDEDSKNKAEEELTDPLIDSECVKKVKAKITKRKCVVSSSDDDNDFVLPKSVRFKGVEEPDVDSVANRENASDNPMELLLATEYGKVVQKTDKKSNAKSKKNKRFAPSSDEDDESDAWEELPAQSENVTNSISIKPLSRSSTGKDAIDQDIQRYISLLWKRFVKSQALALRKVHMMCCLARGLFLDRVCNYSYVQSFALSVVPLNLFPPTTVGRQNTKRSKSERKNSKVNITDILGWYRKAFTLEKKTSGKVKKSESLLEVFANKATSSRTLYLQGLVSVLRCLDIPTRILIHFSPKVINFSEKAALKKSVPSSKNSRGTDNEAIDKYLHLQIVPFECDSSLGFDMWIEVFDAEKEKWLPVDPYSLVICKPEQIEDMLHFSSRTQKITFVVAYALAFGPERSVSDVTPRYASNGLYTSTRRERGPTEIAPWWSLTLQHFQLTGPLGETDEAELSYLSSSECHPVPKTVSELQQHPLYVLARHIHKYEALYPPDSKPVAKVHDESVFLRSNVKPMHTEGKWMQEGRSIKPGEQPYKEVPGQKRARKKSDKPVPLSGLYGEWQTELFKPPPIVDDKIPRNKFGNYEFFKPWMLPEGTSHMKLPGVQIIARRLGFDYAPAMVGWDFHGGVNHPVIDGIIICQKYRAQLERAWREDQTATELTREAKKTENALMNWRRIVKALLLGEKLRQRYL